MNDTSLLHLSGLTLVGVVTLVGYYAGHTARFVKLPSLIGYMILGVVLGPSLLNIFSEPSMENLSFITEVALGFVAFGIGAELRLSDLKRLGPGIVSIIFAESFGAFFAVLALIYLVTGDLALSLVFASMAPASAPAGTVAVIQEYNCKGPLTKALYAVVGFDDGLAIIIFGFAAAMAKKLLTGQAVTQQVSMLAAMWAPLREIMLSILIGALAGFLLCQLVRKLQNSRDMLIIVFGVVLVAAGLSVRWHLSLILTNLVVGLVLSNTRHESVVNRVTAPLREIMPLLFLLFFCLAGAHLQLSALPGLGLVGVVYIFGRSAGLIGGARLGAMFGKVDENVKKYVGLGILSQAGVAIGLSLILKQDLDQLGTERACWIGASVLTSITATCIFFEVVGPILTRIALKKAGEIPEDTLKQIS